MQYIIELAVAGQVDNQECTLSSVTKLERLREQQAAWDDLRFSREYQIPMDRSRYFWELRGGVLAETNIDGNFTFHQLPSDLRSIEEKSWKLCPEVIGACAFGMDPAQDLLVLIQNPNSCVIPGS